MNDALLLLPMVERVKYHSPLRAERARETKRLIRDAARKCFVGRGYGTTTIPEIAAAAGVAEQTVYAVFGSKRAMLEELVRLGVRGEDGETALADTDAWVEMLDAPTAREVVDRFATICEVIYGRVGDILEAVRSARGSDPALAELSQQHDRARRSDLGGVAKRLAELHALRSGLTAQTAADALWTISSPEVYKMLVVDRGWSRRRYRDWLADTLAATLLR